MKIRLSELAARFGLVLKGLDREVTGVNTLEAATPDEVSFLSNKKYAPALDSTRAGAVILSEDMADRVETALVSSNPYLSLAQVSSLFAKPQGCFEGQSELAYVHPDAQIAEDAVVYPFAFVGARARIGSGTRVFSGCYVGEDSAIGENCTLYPNVSVMAQVTIGNNVIIHPGVVVGSDGFGYAQSPQGLFKVPQVGPVEIADNVEIGANTAVDRGSLDVTRIGTGVKVDNLCQIAHNVKIGDHSILVAQVGVSGSTTLGRGVILAGQAGLVGHINVGDGCMVGAQAGVNHDLAPGSKVMGSPAIDHGRFLRTAATLPKLPDMNKRLKKLEKELAALKSQLDQGE